MTQQTGLFHNVFFWLAEGSPADAAQQIVEGCRKYLPGIPGVLRLTVGAPAGGDSGAPVDSSYAVALLVEFADSAAHDAYEGHADHLRFLDEYGAYFGRVVVYDVAPGS